MFRALRVEKPTPDDPVSVSLRRLTDDDLPPGSVTVDISHSSINFKDGLALAGRPGVIRDHPRTPGIDLVGTVADSADDRWAVGDGVILTGWGVGERHDGGLAERARVDGDWLVALPEGLEPHHAAAIGTAGFTAMLSVLALERHGIPEGDVLVTGATGGVGSIAIALLGRTGRRIVASTGTMSETAFLESLGAHEVIDRALLGEPGGKPLQAQRWAGAVDCVGSHTLANVLAQTRYGGAVATSGLAQGAELSTTVMPFILRGVSLLGVNSVETPRDVREPAWARLASDLDRDLLDTLTTTVRLEDAPRVADEILAGSIRGRTVVDVRM